uniref:Uncharacterized protein n=1 Tax=Lactuca sativa TaxID=4236 RepID=A0A9R1W252_LACSA|nr:hypothetical protein LSAT_V11C300124140 [Lactuca sativa]
MSVTLLLASLFSPTQSLKMPPEILTLLRNNGLEVLELFTMSNLFSYFSSKKKTPISEDVSHFVVGVSVFSYTELEDATRNFNPSQEQRIGGFGVVYYGAKPLNERESRGSAPRRGVHGAAAPGRVQGAEPLAGIENASEIQI